MTWTRFDDDFPHHPKVLRAGALGLVLQVRATCWASHYLTDGLLPADAIPALVVGLEAYDPRTPAQWAEHMVTCGLWDLAPGGFRVHDYGAYNPTKREVLRARKNAAQQRIEAGRARARTGNRNDGGRFSPAGEPADHPATAPAEKPADHQPHSPSHSPSPAHSHTNPQGVELSAPAAAGTARRIGPAKNSARREARTAAVWSAYSAAYVKRYRTNPVRNEKINGQLARFIERLGAEEAPAVAAFYVGHNAALYVRSRHAVDLLLRDCEGLRTDWATGRPITDAAARALDQQQERGTVWNEMIARAKAEAADGR